MSFQPIVPLSGYTGWRFLERTLDSQQEAFSQSAPIQRATDAFREKIGNISTAAELVADRQLLEVALGAFGLGDDINSKFFINKILEDGVIDEDSLANKLSDSRYKEFSEAFGFDLDPPNTKLSFFADDIIDRYETQQFAIAVGEQDDTMRIALNLSPALDGIIESNTSDDARWFAMMGNAALRSLFDTSMGFSESFAALDLDKQLVEFRSRAEAMFGTNNMEDLTSEENQEKLIRMYMVRSQMQNNGDYSSASIALTLLQS